MNYFFAAPAPAPAPAHSPACSCCSSTDKAFLSAKLGEFKETLNKYSPKSSPLSPEYFNEKRIYWIEFSRAVNQLFGYAHIVFSVHTKNEHEFMKTILVVFQKAKEYRDALVQIKNGYECSYNFNAEERALIDKALRTINEFIDFANVSYLN